MNLATVIQENRKKKGLTQEQLAEMVGVSAPAVSKWESAGSFPDITLLAPIARALGVTVDTLVGFRPGLSEEEVHALEQECDELFRREGIEAGSARCEALLREYPNCAYLKLRIASVYQRAMLQLADGSEAALEPAYRRFYELYQQVYDSGDPRLHDAAAVILAGKALSDGDTARAEALLAELPQAEYKPDSLYPLLYLKKGETAKAVELLEKQVATLGNELGTALNSLASIASQEGDDARALACCHAGSAISEALGLPGVNAFLQALTLLAKHGPREEAVRAAVRYLDSAAVFGSGFAAHPFLSHLGQRPQPQQADAVRRILLKGFMDEEAFAPLRDDAAVQQALDRLRATLPD